MIETLSTNKGVVIVNDDIKLRRIKSAENTLAETEYQRLRAHRERKWDLSQLRLVVLRNYIRQCYGSVWINDAAHWNEIEKRLDHMLKEYAYDLEKAIDYYRLLAPNKIERLVCQCGYVPPFCPCVEKEDEAKAKAIECL